MDYKEERVDGVKETLSVWTVICLSVIEANERTEFWIGILNKLFDYETMIVWCIWIEITLLNE